MADQTEHPPRTRTRSASTKAQQVRRGFTMGLHHRQARPLLLRLRLQHLRLPGRRAQSVSTGVRPASRLRGHPRSTPRRLERSSAPRGTP
eukprot:6190281-Alexandrium_andersonii.AAC.1